MNKEFFGKSIVYHPSLTPVTRKLADTYYAKNFFIKVDWSTWPEDEPLISWPLPDGVEFEKLNDPGA